MAGDLTVERCGALFAKPSRRASSNYGIGTDGRIALYVEEKNRSWCSSSSANDNQAITIEVANDTIGGNWHISDKAYKSLINLCVDICERNNIEKLVFTGDANGNLTQHNYFAATECPGAYLKSKFPDIATEVNKRLSNKITPAAPTTGLYRVRKAWNNAESQVGAFKELDNAKDACNKAGAGYSVYDATGKKIYSFKAAFEPYKVEVTAESLNIRTGAGTNYKKVGEITDKGIYTITAEKAGEGAKLWGKLKSGAGWIALDYTKRQK